MDPEPTTEVLWQAINSLWGWMGVAEVRAIREDEPDLYELARLAHERVCHGQRIHG